MTDDRNNTTEENGTFAEDEISESVEPAEPDKQSESPACEVQSEPRDDEPHTLPPTKDRKKSMRNWWIKTTFILVLIIVSIVVMFGITKYIPGGEATERLSELVKGINTDFLLILLAVCVFYILVETAKYAYMLKISTGKFRFRVSFKTMFLGKYYDGITPMSTGGQPFQIYYLHKKHDIPKGAATAIPLVRYLVSAFVVTIISIVLLAITPGLNLEKSVLTTTMYALSWVSIALNCFFPLVIIFFSMFPNKTKRILAGIISLLAKLRLVKRKYATMKRWIYELNEYSRSIKGFTKKFYELIPVIFLSALETMISYSVPFFTVLAIAGSGEGAILPTAELYVQVICLSMLTRYTALLVPTPGNTGAAEASGILAFSTVAAMIPSKIGWAVLIWRFLTYYIYILTGIGINIFEIIRSAVRNKRAQKRE